jgi:hypothetical protein
MRRSSNPGLRLILADLEHASRRLDLGPDAPARNEGARECRITRFEAIVLWGVIAHPSASSLVQDPDHAARRPLISRTAA